MHPRVEKFNTTQVAGELCYYNSALVCAFFTGWPDSVASSPRINERERMSEERDRWRAQFEEMGEEWVRAAIDLGKLRGRKLATAKQWLGKKDRAQEREERSKREGVKSAQFEISRLAKDAARVSTENAKTANAIAKIAIGAAIVAIAITIAGWFFNYGWFFN